MERSPDWVIHVVPPVVEPHPGGEGFTKVIFVDPIRIWFEWKWGYLFPVVTIRTKICSEWKYFQFFRTWVEVCTQSTIKGDTSHFVEVLDNSPPIETKGINLLSPKDQVIPNGKTIYVDSQVKSGSYTANSEHRARTGRESAGMFPGGERYARYLADRPSSGDYLRNLYKDLNRTTLDTGEIVTGLRLVTKFRSYFQCESYRIGAMNWTNVDTYGYCGLNPRVDESSYSRFGDYDRFGQVDYGDFLHSWKEGSVDLWHTIYAGGWSNGDFSLGERAALAQYTRKVNPVNGYTPK